MGLIKKIWQNLPFYRTYRFFKSWYDYDKSKKYIGETFYSDGFHEVIRKYLKVDLREDWIGRLYGVVNPNIVNGKFDVSTMVIEIDGDNTNTNNHVKQWVYKQLQLIATLFKIEKLYDYISLEFKHVGPEEMDNYLIIFDMTSRKQFAKDARKFIYNIAFWGVISTITLLCLF